MAEAGASGRVEYEQRGATAILRLCNPNAGLMDEGTEQGLLSCLDRTAADEEVRTVVVTGGEPGVFVRHYDVVLLERRGRSMAERGMSFHPSRPVPQAATHRIFNRIAASPKPFIAAINGVAMGGGFELALACDFRIAEEGDYSIGLPEVNAGLLPGAGGTWHLTRLVGPGRAMEMLCLGVTVAPARAASLGLVHELVPAPVEARAIALAAELEKRSPLALGHIKALVRGRWGEDCQSVLAAERTLFCDLMISADTHRRMAPIARGSKDIRDC